MRIAIMGLQNADVTEEDIADELRKVGAYHFDGDSDSNPTMVSDDEENAALRLASKLDWNFEVWEPIWAKYGLCADLIRNKAMAVELGLALVFVHGKCGGTRHLIEQFRDLDVEVIEIEV